MQHWAMYALVESIGTYEKTTSRGRKLYHHPSIEKLKGINHITFGIDENPWEHWETISATVVNSKGQNMENNKPDPDSSDEALEPNGSDSEYHGTPIEDDDLDTKHHKRPVKSDDNSDTDSFITASERID